jgi:hypothetical protein
MSEAFFYADKANRQAAFHFSNGLSDLTDSIPPASAAVVAGDQSARVHPFPQMRGPQNGQKVGAVKGEPAMGTAFIPAEERDLVPTEMGLRGSFPVSRG